MPSLFIMYATPDCCDNLINNPFCDFVCNHIFITRVEKN